MIHLPRAERHKIVVVAVGIMNRFSVYIFGKRCWKAFEGFPYAAYDWSSTRGNRTAGAYCLNGVLHWVVRAVGGQKEVIVTYDLHSNRFGEMAVPSAPSSVEKMDISVMGKAALGRLLESAFGSSKIDTTTLGELKGKLCLVYKISDFRRVRVWVLKESPVWVMKEYRVEHRYRIRSTGWSPYYRWR